MSAVLPACIARPATFADLDAVSDLLHRVFGVRHTVEFLRWKLTGCAGRLIGSTVLAADRRIVGFLGQIPVRIRVADREVLAAQGTDAGILEEYRRLDVFLGMIQTSVLEMKAAGVELTYGTANADFGPLAMQLFGRKRLAPVPLLVRPLSPGDVSLGWGARLLACALSASDRLNEREPAALRDRFRMARITRFDERFDRFWREVQDDYPVMLVRDAAHLNWRYVDAPNVAYERIGIVDVAAGRIAGYAVLGLRRRNGRLRGHIADLVTARNGDPRIVNLLVRAAVAWLRAQAADVAEVWALPHTHLRRTLVCRGFIPRRTGPGGFQVSALATAADASPLRADEAGSWFLSMGDSDTV
jgi:hypothetical protein